ncbi:hypothetical protein LAZ67_2005836 [Cordylochernes scorpioides]|uniref:Transposase Tc1-like domain-containing protein n=1 Tax=Cordylochernes scorpioides TaxID=51811 RepID=A0ABY6K6D7_9ARAC|nr:hypothetical protein LAZ67_2005836 [Cordylochernes scorpioides]
MDKTPPYPCRYCDVQHCPDIAPSDYYLFRSMQPCLADQHFSNYNEVKNASYPTWTQPCFTCFFPDGDPVCSLPSLESCCRPPAFLSSPGGHRKRRQFKQTDAFTRGKVIGLKRAGWSIRQIAADTHLGASTVHRLWRRWLEQGNVAIYKNVGATRVTSARVDRRILRQAVAAPQATCTAILQHVQDTLDHSISTRTISRRLVANGLHSCRPLRRLPLTPPNRRQRLEWCRARSTWMTEWHRVVFSDESRFCLSSDSRRVRVWRRRGERSNPAAIVERPTVRQRGIMVWGAIAYDSRSPLLRIQGTMTAQRYVDDVLRPVTLPYLQGVPNALYQQDNARPHTARISQQALQDVQMLPWPPYSPDLSPIEHKTNCGKWFEREWKAIPQDAIRTLIDSLPRRVAACIAVRGADAVLALYYDYHFEIKITYCYGCQTEALLWLQNANWWQGILGSGSGGVIAGVEEAGEVKETAP